MNTQPILDAIDKEIDRLEADYLTLPQSIDLLYSIGLFKESDKQDENKFRNLLKEGAVAHAYKENGRWRIPKSSFKNHKVENKDFKNVIKEKLPYIIIATFLVLFFIFLKVTDYHNPYKKIKINDTEIAVESVFISDIIDDTIQNGIAKNLYRSTSTISSEGNLIDNKKEGLWKFYNENGILESKSYYKNNLKNGVTEKYSDKGIILEKSTYENDMLNGKLVQYLDGSEDEIYHYKNNKKNGAYKSIDYHNGKPFTKAIGSYENDLMTGEWRTYDYTYNDVTETYGNKLILTEILTYKEDKMNGRNIWFDHQEGFLLHETSFKDDLEHGVRKSYCPAGLDKGKLYIVEKYAYGKLIGKEPYKCECNF